MTGDWTVVFQHRAQNACSDRALVLTSLDIPHEVILDEHRCMLVVPDELAERAKFELWQYEQENRRQPTRQVETEPVYQNAIPGVVVYVIVICLVAWLAGENALGRDWLHAGRIDGSLIRAGEWWRNFTALTLHGDLRHLLGNIVFGGLFGILAGRVAGSGVAWLGIVIAAGLGNVLNTILLDSSHRSIGASTAVFAALGLVSGFVWRGKLMRQDRWPTRLGPIVGGIALLAYTGTGDENTDIGAHLLGFVCGFTAGILLIRVIDYLRGTRAQVTAGLAAVAILVVSWAIALADKAGPGTL